MNVRLTIAALAALAVCAGVAPAAQAVNRYAEPGGQASGACTDPTSGNGCEFEWAVEAAAGANDNVILAPGSYTESGLIAVDNPSVDIIGPGTAQATLNSSGPTALGLNELAEGSSVSGLTIHHTGTGDALFLDDGMLVEELSVTTTTGATACHAPEDAVMFDTVCSNTNAGGVAAILIDPTVPGISGGSFLVNVTAYATGASANALKVLVTTSSVADVTARNSIFRAVGAADIYAFTDTSAGVEADIDADYSAYADSIAANSAAVTSAGTLNNIVALPVFESAAGNFHQAAGSPTIDRGTAAFELSPLDIDGEARIMGSAPDIGADEFVPPPAQQPVVTPAPTTATKACPKGKKLVAKKGKRKCVPKRKRRKR